MGIPVIIFLIIYSIVLGFYFFSETSGHLKRRSINKIVLASLFLIFAIVNYFNNYNFFNYNLIMLFAIIFAFIGDVILLYSFNIGGCSFIVSNILFFIYQIVEISVNKISFFSLWYFIPILLVIFGTFLFFNIKRKIDLKDVRIAILFYLFSVSLHATLSLPLAIYFANTKMTLLSIGQILFMISDYFLMTYKFKSNKKWILRGNSATYFIGLLLIAMSLMY